MVEHDPKVVTVFRVRSCAKEKLERDDGSKKRHHAPERQPLA
jgi:hypothetical protein